jgi:hypothetical protein
MSFSARVITDELCDQMFHSYEEPNLKHIRLSKAIEQCNYDRPTVLDFSHNFIRSLNPFFHLDNKVLEQCTLLDLSENRIDDTIDPVWKQIRQLLQQMPHGKLKLSGNPFLMWAEEEVAILEQEEPEIFARLILSKTGEALTFDDTI